MPTTTSIKPKTSIKSKIASGRSTSRHLATILRKQLTGGTFGPGDQLPSDRMLMEQFDVSYSVANRAMELLAREGLIERQQGQGSFVKEKSSGPQGASPLGTFALVLGYSRWKLNLSLCQGSDAGAGQLHYQTLVCDTENDVDRQASVLMQLIANRVAGIALVPTTQSETPACQIGVCQDCGIPVVLLHRGVKGASVPVIAIPFEEMGHRVGRAVFEQGHRRVAFVFDERYVATEQYEAGLRRAMEECDGGLQELFLYCAGRNEMSMPSEHAAFLEDTLARILRTPDQHRPTAIVGLSEHDAQWIYLRLMKMGVRVPEQMSLVTFGSTLRQRVFEEQLTAVTVDEMGVGQLAAQLLLEMRSGKRRIDNSEQFTADVSFHAGQTLGPAPMAAEQTMKE